MSIPATPPAPDATWRIAVSNRRTVIQSSPVSYLEANALIRRIRDKVAEFDVTHSDPNDPMDAYTFDMFYKPEHSLSIKQYDGESGSRVEVRNMPPQFFSKVMAVPVEDKIGWTRRHVEEGAPTRYR